MITQPQSIDKTPTGNDVNIATLQSIPMGVAHIQNYIKMLDIKFSEKISAISDKLNLVHSDKEMIQQLNNERRDLQATIDMLMRVDSAHSRGDKAYANQPPRDSTSSHSALWDATPVITANRFTLLADTTELTDTTEGSELTDTTEYPVTEAERLIDSYYDVLNSNQCAKSNTREIKNKQAKPIPFQEQLNQYRKRHRDQLIRPTSCKSKTDVVVGDSMIKHINGHRLTRSKQVKCAAKPGDNIYAHAIGQIKEHRPTEIILHVGTNNTKDNPEDIRDMIVSVGESIKSESMTDQITLSGIIHRYGESNSERTKIKMAHGYLKEAADKHWWSFIDNSNITSKHLCSDGVHLSKHGQGVFAKNILHHLYPGSTRAPRARPPGPMATRPLNPADSTPITYADAVRVTNCQVFPRPAWKTRKRAPHCTKTHVSTWKGQQNSQNIRRPLASQATEWFRYQQRMDYYKDQSVNHVYRRFP